MYLLRAGTIGLIALALAADGPRALVFALAALAAVVGAPVRPATLALVPMLARTPQELVAANVSSSTLEGVGTSWARSSAACSPPATASPSRSPRRGVYVVCAVLVSASTARATYPRAQRESSATLSASCSAASARSRGAAPSPDRPAVRLADDGAGVLNVLLVVAAFELMATGRPGSGG